MIDLEDLLFPDRRVHFNYVTERISCQKIPVRSMGPDPASPHVDRFPNRACFSGDRARTGFSGFSLDLLNDRPLRFHGEHTNWPGYTFACAPIFAMRIPEYLR